MDFNDIDALVKPVVEFLDHRYIASSESIQNSPYFSVAPPDDIASIPEIQRSTAEELCQWIFDRIQATMSQVLAGGSIVLYSVSLRETVRNTAEVIND